jgi:hypothetical protein
VPDVTDEGIAADLSGIGAQELEAEDPRRIGAFPIRAVLGSGGMGRVYLGISPSGYAAVKQVLPELARSPIFLRHFGQELDNQARLPAGVSARLLAADRTARPPWFATAYIPGVTLHDAVHLNGGSLPAAHVWVLLRELAGRLASVARLEMVHRDLKPSNVMLTAGGVTLIDFGVARAADQSSVTATGIAVGTPAYMAPEQARARKDLTPAVDVFSLGGLLTFAATGEPPFGDGSGADQFYRVVHDEPDLDALRERDCELADLVASCLAKDPAARPSAAELVELAEQHARSGPPAWPTVVAELITVRRTFAQHMPAAQPDETELEVEMPPEQSAPQEPEENTGPEAEVEVEAQQQKPEKRRRGRRTMALLLPVVLVGGTAGTILALNKVPFTTPQNPGATGSALAGGVGTSAPASASAPGSASGSASAGHTGSASPSHAGSASAGPGGGATGGGGGGVATGGGPVTTHTTSGASGGGGGGGGGGTSDPAVVATSYSEIKNVAKGLCIGNQYGTNNTVATPMTCDGDAGEGWQTQNASDGTFQLVEKNTGACLFDFVSSNGSVSIFMCNSSSTDDFWRVGTTTSKGGELVNVSSGHCLAYTYTFQNSLTTSACDSADSDQLWYDAGRT